MSLPTSSFSSSSCILEVPFPLLALHRGVLVVIDQAALPFRLLGQQHLADDLRQRLRFRLDRARQRIAAEGAEAYALLDGDLAGTQAHAVVVDHDERAVALDHAA